MVAISAPDLKLLRLCIFVKCVCIYTRLLVYHLTRCLFFSFSSFMYMLFPRFESSFLLYISNVYRKKQKIPAETDMTTREKKFFMLCSSFLLFIVLRFFFIYIIYGFCFQFFSSNFWSFIKRIIFFSLSLCSLDASLFISHE